MKFTSRVLFFCTLASTPAVSMAASNNATPPSQQEMAKLNTQTANLSKEMQALQEQLITLRKEQAQLEAQQHPTSGAKSHTQLAASETTLAQPFTHGKATQHTTSSSTASMGATGRALHNSANGAPEVKAKSNAAPSNGSSASSNASSTSSNGSLHPIQSITVSTPNGQKTIQLDEQQRRNITALRNLASSGYLSGSPVVTSPYLGVRSEYNGGDLVVNLSSVNTDLAILQQRQSLEDAAKSIGMDPKAHPRLIFSGEVEGQTTYTNPYSGPNNTNIDLTDAELDVVAAVDPWLTGYMVMAYDNGSTTASGNRTNSSNLYLDRAFLTLGNLNKFPAYATAGQLYVPFGQYTSYMISDPVTKTLGRIKARALVLGYNQNVGKYDTGITSAIFGFKGDTSTGNNTPSGPSSVNNFGANLEMSQDFGPVTTDVGTSYIYNIADSDGMQVTGASYGGFVGFDGASTAAQSLMHRVPAIDGRASAGYGPFSVISEYVGTLRSFDPTNLSYNGHGAHPDAFHVEGVYQRQIFGKPTSFAVGYGHTWEALGLNLPQDRYLATINMAIFKDALASIEVRHSINYASSDTATGNAPVAGTGVATAPPGKHENVVTGQLDLYF